MLIVGTVNVKILFGEKRGGKRGLFSQHASCIAFVVLLCRLGTENTVFVGE